MQDHSEKHRHHFVARIADERARDETLSKLRTQFAEINKLIKMTSIDSKEAFLKVFDQQFKSMVMMLSYQPEWCLSLPQVLQFSGNGRALMPLSRIPLGAEVDVTNAAEILYHDLRSLPSFNNLLQAGSAADAEITLTLQNSLGLAPPSSLLRAFTAQQNAPKKFDTLVVRASHEARFNKFDHN